MSLALCFLIFAGFSSINVDICKASPVISPTVTNAAENAYPFVVSIQVKRKMSWNYSRFVHYCGGSLITREHVLTAAHCFRGKYKTTSFRVLVGSNDLQSDKTYHLIKSWLIFEQWAMENNIIVEYSENDIAIVELSSLVDARIKLAKITSASNDELRNQQVLSAGWGRTSDGNLPRYMVEVHLKMISREECLQNIRDARDNPTDEPDILNHALDANTFCTNGDPYAVLYCGDSGSPLFWKDNEIIGINESICPHEAQDPLMNTKAQNIHVDARLYLDFIAATTNCTIEEFTPSPSCCIM